MKKILFLTISDRLGASSRQRVYQYLPSFGRAGYDARVMPPGRKGSGPGRIIRLWAEQRNCLAAARDADIIFIQKRLFKRGFLEKLRSLGKPVVFDFDDSIFTSPSGDWSAATKTRVQDRLGATLRMSDLVVAGSGYLAEYAREAGAGRVLVMPTGIDLAKYGLKMHAGGNPLVLGWIGGSANHRYIDLLAGVLKAITAEMPDTTLLVVSDKDYALDGVQVDNVRWSEETEAESLLRMDVGLMPLSDDSWTRGKCAYKALQYMSSGIPAVCSPVGSNMEVVEDGVDGYLPDGEEAWLDALRGLAASPEKRAAMGRAGRTKVERFYSAPVLGLRYNEILRSLR